MYKPSSTRRTIREQIITTVDSLETGYLFGEFVSKCDHNAALAVFEYESMIAGIADKLIRGSRILSRDLDLLGPPILSGTKLHVMQEHGQPDKEYDIRHLECVLPQAQKIEQLRVLCLQYIKKCS